MVSWIYDLEDNVFAYLSIEMNKKLPYGVKSINFTQEEPTITSSTKFPTLYFHILPMSEIGTTTERDKVEAVPVTFQVDIFTKGKEQANRILAGVDEKMREIGFIGNQSPNFSTVSSTVSRCIGRFTRSVGSDDKLVKITK